MRRGTNIILILVLYGIAILASGRMLRTLMPPVENKNLTEALAEDRKPRGRKLSESVVALALGNSEKDMAVGLESGAVDLWTTSPAPSKRTFKAHDGRSNWLTFTADGSGLFTGSEFGTDTKLWDVKTGDLRVLIPDARGPVGQTPNPNIYVVANTSSFRLFDLRTQTAYPGTYQASGVILSLTSNPRSGRIALGTASGSIDIWQYSQTAGKPTLTQTATAKPYATGDWVVGLHFSSAGDRLVSVARKGTVNEWKSQTLQGVREISTNLGWIGAAAFLDRRKNLFWDETVIAVTGTQHPSGLSKGFLQIIPPDNPLPQPIPLHTNLPTMTDSPNNDAFLVIHSRSAELFRTTP